MARIVPERLNQSLRGIDAQASRSAHAPSAEPDASVRLPESYDLVCYDTETTDKHRDFSQILQFAGLRTDRDFNVVNSRNLTVRLLPYAVASPGALAVNGVDFRSLDDDGRHDEFDAAIAIASLLNSPRNQSRVFLTFNGISFDDEIIRRTLFRNLQYPYFSNDADCRIDVMYLARLVAAAPEAGLRVPVVPEGDKVHRVFKLTALCEANGIDLIDAHDALGDARATLALANLLRRIAPWAWNAAFACGRPDTVIRRAEAAKAGGRPLWLFDAYGPDGELSFVPCAVIGRVRKQVALASLITMHESPLPDPLPSADVMRFCGKDNRGTDGFDTRPVLIENLGKAPYLLTSEEVRHFLPENTIRTMEAAAMRFSGRTEEIAILDAHTQKAREWDNGVTAEENIYGESTCNRDDEKGLMRRFNSVARWPDAIDAGMALKDWRHRDFAARILLRMCTEAELDARGPGIAAELRRRAAEALARPFGPPVKGGKGWVTVADVMEDETTPPEMREWLGERYVDPSPNEEDEELGCGLGAAMPGR